jgi:hypothetical protein
MAEATEESSSIWLQALPGALDRLPTGQVRIFLLSQLREIDGEIARVRSGAPSDGWWLLRAGEPPVDLNAPEWDPLLYLEYLQAMRRAIVAALRLR